MEQVQKNLIESGIIACLLLDQTRMYECYGKVIPEMFENPFYKEAYSEILGLYDSGERIDIPSLSTKMERHYDMQQTMLSLAECLKEVDSSIVLPSLVEKIQLDYRARRVKDAIQKVNLIPNDIDDSIGKLLQELEDIQQAKENTSQSLSEIVDECKDNYFTDKPKKIVKTGFYRLDEILGGLEAGDVCVIGARPAVGKSALATQIIGNVAEQGLRVGYFNLEMVKSQVYERFVARNGGLTLTRIRRAKDFCNDEKEKFDKANEKIKKMDVRIYTGSKTVSEIKHECRHQGFDLIVIDYLQLVKADRQYANRSSEVGNISKTIKELAMELNVPVILLSQLNRVSEGRDTKEPTMAELRESGDVEQDASQIILIWNLSEDNKSYKGLKIDKNRQGELGKEGLLFNGAEMCFEERYKESFEQFKSKADGIKGIDFAIDMDAEEGSLFK